MNPDARNAAIKIQEAIHLHTKNLSRVDYLKVLEDLESDVEALLEAFKEEEEEKEEE